LLLALDQALRLLLLDWLLLLDELELAELWLLWLDELELAELTLKELELADEDDSVSIE
jgi:hypothetical protein